MIDAVEEIVSPPSLSVALAVMSYVPIARFSQENEYGWEASSPNLLVPSKNSTLAMVPSKSEAETSIKAVSPETKTAPFSGAVKDTLGSELDPFWTLTNT